MYFLFRWAVEIFCVLLTASIIQELLTFLEDPDEYRLKANAFDAHREYAKLVIFFFKVLETTSPWFSRVHTLRRFTARTCTRMHDKVLVLERYCRKAYHFLKDLVSFLCCNELYHCQHLFDLFMLVPSQHKLFTRENLHYWIEETWNAIRRAKLDEIEQEIDSTDRKIKKIQQGRNTDQGRLKLLVEGRNPIDTKLCRNSTVSFVFELLVILYKI